MIHVFKEGTSRETFVVFHGTGGDEHDLIPVAQMVSPDANILSLRGSVSEQGMLRFFKRLSEGVFDQADIRLQAREIVAFIREAVSEHHLDPEHLTALGYSNGANIIAAILLLHGSVFREAILLHPMVPLDEIPDTDLTGARVFIGAGENDPIVAPDNTRRLEAVLREKGADIRSSWYRNGHTLTMDEIKDATAWHAETETLDRP